VLLDHRVLVAGPFGLQQRCPDDARHWSCFEPP
jgi:hypothetical protein